MICPELCLDHQAVCLSPSQQGQGHPQLLGLGNLSLPETLQRTRHFLAANIKGCGQVITAVCCSVCAKVEAITALQTEAEKPQRHLLSHQEHPEWCADHRTGVLQSHPSREGAEGPLESQGAAQCCFWVCSCSLTRWKVGSGASTGPHWPQCHQIKKGVSEMGF